MNTPDDTPLTFAHTSDLHLLVGGPEGIVLDRTPLVERLVALLNERRVAFVIDTGDLVSRYATSPKAVLSPEAVRWQVERACELLARLDAPFYFTPGNHDVAFPWCREAWREAQPAWWPDGCFSFDRGDCHFAMLDSSSEYDEHTLSPTRLSINEEHLDWLRADLRRAADRRLRLLFTHYDHQRQLDPLLEPLRVNGLFYGHAAPIACEQTPTPWTNGHLAGDRACQFVTVRGAEVSVEPGPRYDELGTAPPAGVCADPAGSGRVGAPTSRPPTCG